MRVTRESVTLGINSAYHESSAAIFVGSTLVHAVEEERLTRIKHAKPALVSNPDQIPWRAIRECLNAAGLDGLQDCDAIGYSLQPGRRSSTIGLDPYTITPAIGFGTPDGEREFDERIRRIPLLLAEQAGHPEVAGRVHFVAHHVAHAASAFVCSPFDDAALLVIDGIGEDSTAWLGTGDRNGVRTLEEVPYPHSIGLLWERIAAYLGFTEYDACKVMGLAACGDPDRFEAEFNRLFAINDQPPTSSPNFSAGRARLPPSRIPQADLPYKFVPADAFVPFRIDVTLAQLRSGDVQGLESLFGPRRQPGESWEGRFADVAACLQTRTERAVLALCHRLAALTGQDRLAYSGGVALNCIANARIEREGPFDEIYIIGAAHDAGTAIGAAAEVAKIDVYGKKKPHALSPFLGSHFSIAQAERAATALGFTTETPSAPIMSAVDRLIDGEVVGWFQGRLEFGPRALGNRSLLADPRNEEVRERLNRRVKHRETFRPFGASIREEDLADWFDVPSSRPGARASRDLMLLAYRLLPEKAALVPAVVHADGTCRIQTVNAQDQPEFHKLLTEFGRRTGVPLLLNTSFNDQEPLVASPDDALRTFELTGIDSLFLGDRLISRRVSTAFDSRAISIPPANQLFPVVADSYGKRLALVFGNHAFGGECPFYTANRCFHCDIGRGEGTAFDADANLRRLDWFMDYYRAEWHDVAHLVLYNSGSILNPVELPFEVLTRILERVRGFPSLKIISLDTRETFVTVDRLLKIAERLRDDQQARVIIGLESANEEIRNGRLKKAMPIERVQRAFDDVAIAADQSSGRIGIDINVLVGGPGTTPHSAVTDAVDTVRFVLTNTRVSVDFNIHPYYRSTRGITQFPNHPACTEIVLRAAVEAIESECAAQCRDSRIFIGHYDEGHDTEGIEGISLAI